MQTNKQTNQTSFLKIIDPIVNTVNKKVKGCRAKAITRRCGKLGEEKECFQEYSPSWKNLQVCHPTKNSICSRINRGKVPRCPSQETSRDCVGMRKRRSFCLVDAENIVNVQRRARLKRATLEVKRTFERRIFVAGNYTRWKARKRRNIAMHPYEDAAHK